MPEIKNATPTWYNGVKYRSKLEAKCAEILDKAGIAFEYESLKMELLPKFVYMGKTYQPWTYKTDFIIFDDIILEVKGFKKADNYVNKRKMIMKHIVDNNLPYYFYEIYSDSHLRVILGKYKKLGNFHDAYTEYDNELKARQKERRLKKKNKKKL